MHYHELANTMRAHAEAATGRIPKSCMATISSYNASTHSVKVTFQGVGDNDFTETGWMMLDAVGVGNGFGVLSAPNIGDMVMISFTDGSSAAPKITGRFFSTINTPPAVPAGETWIVHKSGALMKFHNDGSVEIAAATTIKYTAEQHHFIGPVLMDNTLTGMQGIAISGDNGTGNASTVTGNFNTTGTITNNSHDIGSTHKHVNSGGSGLGGVPQ
jgi:uncharacterized protein involved in type VI secretion and phage assembly